MKPVTVAGCCLGVRAAVSHAIPSARTSATPVATKAGRIVLLDVRLAARDAGGLLCAFEQPDQRALPRTWPAIAASTAARVSAGDAPTAGTSRRLSSAKSSNT